MNRDQAYLNNVSLRLSEVLCDIGVNERMVLKRRRMTMLNEHMKNIDERITMGTHSNYCFGSQSEGTTTLGLNSDIDILRCDLSVNVIQGWSQWKPGVLNLLMIQDETTSPGYCLLQELRDDVPLPSTEQHPLGQRGKVLCMHSIFENITGYTIHGPAQSPKSEPGFVDEDHVRAFCCESWPVEAQPWLERQGIGGWPTEDMKRYCVNTGCFVVPVSNTSGQNSNAEWRISTSQAERCLMFSLNITQLRCYILMKMILKTFINPPCNGAISSYMCKTVLFHCIQNTHSNKWQDDTLLPCLTHCLLALQNCIRKVNCPHFIIPGNNLMAGRISAPVRNKLLEILQNIIETEGQLLLEIPIDNLGARLQEKMNIIPMVVYPTPDQVSSHISSDLLTNTARMVSNLHKEHLRQVMYCSNDTARLRLSDFIFSLASPDISCTSSLNKSIFELLFPLLCSSLGSVIASSDIQMNNTISQQALEWFSAGLNSDVSSGKLKFASALYCTRDMERTEIVLKKIEDQYDHGTVASVGQCLHRRTALYLTKSFSTKCSTGNEEVIKQVIAFCVRFMQCEKDCVPKELQYEMFRSTEDDRMKDGICHRDIINYWMDWAVVDSLPYLYFLQYKTYGRLQRPAGQQRALTFLAHAIDKERNFHHRETALNLLEQCMEQENRYNDALRCYVRSLNIRPRNNAANIHICRLLSSLVNRRVAG